MAKTKSAKPDRKQVRRLAERFQVDKPGSFRLKDWGCADTAGIKDQAHGQALLAYGIERLSKLQERLYAQDRWSVLLLFQAMDAAGKDSTIKHVMSGVSPQGCQVWSFKRPSEEELDHDWLWRGLTRLPERGRIGIHNRSWYEEVLVARVHPEVLARQRTPPSLVGKHVWEERFQSINDVERHLARNGTLILKFFLNVSREEQRKRFLARLDDPEKHWKFAPADVRERARWGDYMEAYEDAIQATSKPWARWHVIPADHKWFMRLAVAAIVVDALERLDLKFPEAGPEEQAEFADCRVLLEGGKVGQKGGAAPAPREEA